jgi:DNA-binding transcriptional ArsR family regulator
MIAEPRELTHHLSALASPTRLRILGILAAEDEMAVSALAGRLRMSQPRISWHLRILRLGGAVRCRRDGRQVHCSLNRQVIRDRQSQLLTLLGIGSPGPVAHEETR